jgi:hypothetical protein
LHIRSLQAQNTTKKQRTWDEITKSAIGVTIFWTDRAGQEASNLVDRHNPLLQNTDSYLYSIKEEIY